MSRSYASRGSGWLAVVLLPLVLLVLPSLARARTFYVSQRGSDRASGRSPRRPWRTVLRVDRAHLRPGDVVRFRGGARFTDDTLMPGWGSALSGRPKAPIVFGSYGRGRATITQGIWLAGSHDLTFDGLALGPAQGISGTGDDIVVAHCEMRDFFGNVQIPLQPRGSRWWILDNLIDRTGDSGMLLRGSGYVVAGNRVTRTGLNGNLGYGTHGIYDKATDSVVIDNTVAGYRNDGISVRYGNSRVQDNHIAGGQFGIAWFQYDPSHATSVFTGNTISGASIAGIYVSKGDIGGPTNEDFVIAQNRIVRPRHPEPGWKAIALSPNQGRYAVRANSVQK